MQASLTVRTNEEFDSCRVRKGRDDIVSISDRDRGQQVRLETFLVYLGNGSIIHLRKSLDRSKEVQT